MRYSELFAQRAQVLFHQFGVEPVVPGRHGCMRSKNYFSRYLAGRGVEVQSFFFHPASDCFEHRKAAVSLIQVQNARRNAHGLQRAKASHAKQQFLANAHAAVPAIQARCQFAILGRVSLHIRIQQQQVAASNFEPPHLGLDAAAPRMNFHQDRLAVWSNGRLHGQMIDIGLQVLFPLPAALIQSLQKVALPVEQAHSNQRNVQIGCALDMVATQHAQSAGIDRQRFVQSKLGGEIRHGPRPQHTGIGRAPGPVRIQVLLLAPVYVVDAAMQD